MTPNLSKINGAFLDADAIAQGIPLCFASSRKVLTPGRRSSESDFEVIEHSECFLLAKASFSF